MSTAMIGLAPASADPAMAATPTPPQPITATDLPRVTAPVLIAAPMPAITPQPWRPTAAGRASGSTLVHWPAATRRSEEHTSELQSLMRISYAVFCLKKKKQSSLHIIILKLPINIHTTEHMEIRQT